MSTSSATQSPIHVNILCHTITHPCQHPLPHNHPSMSTSSATQSPIHVNILCHTITHPCQHLLRHKHPSLSTSPATQSLLRINIFCITISSARSVTSTPRPELPVQVACGHLERLQEEDGDEKGEEDGEEPLQSDGRPEVVAVEQHHDSGDQGKSQADGVAHVHAEPWQPTPTLCHRAAQRLHAV